MDDSARLERIRAWVEGRLSSEEAARLEQELEGDAGLREFAAEYREVHALTAAAAGTSTRSSVSYASLERSERGLRPRSTGVLRGAAAAAALVLAVWGWRWLELRGLRGAAVQLSTLTPVADPVPWEDPAALATLADYVPVADDEIHWVRSLEDAREMARATSRPLFVFGMYPGCPLAQRIREDALSDDAVKSLTESFIPVEVDLWSVDSETRAHLEEGGYPVLEVQDAAGRLLCNFSETYDVHEFYRRLEQGLLENDTEPLDWNLSQECAALYAEARRAEQASAWSRAHAAYTDLAEFARRGTFHEAAQRGLERIAFAAGQAVLAAQERAGPEGIEFLRARLEEFRGTPHAGDLALLLQQAERLQRFPEFAWAAPAAAGD